MLAGKVAFVTGASAGIGDALPHLKRARAADVITLASEAGRRGIPGEAVYCAKEASWG